MGSKHPRGGGSRPFADPFNTFIRAQSPVFRKQIRDLVSSWKGLSLTLHSFSSRFPWFRSGGCTSLFRWRRGSISSLQCFTHAGQRGMSNKFSQQSAACSMYTDFKTAMSRDCESLFVAHHNIADIVRSRLNVAKRREHTLQAQSHLSRG